MEQMHINEADIVQIDYEQPGLPAPIKDFRPTVYKNGDRFNCVLGPTPSKGIFGSGTSIVEALAHWNIQFLQRISNPLLNDEVVQYIKDVQATSKLDVG